MKVVYHPAVQRDVNGILRHYDRISPAFGDEFWDDLMGHIQEAARNPEHFHFGAPDRRRVNLQKFPYYFLFRLMPGVLRITVVRHHKRHPRFGLSRR